MPVYYLQMMSPDELVPTREIEGLHLQTVTPPDSTLNHRFYHAVGGPWGWNERVDWTPAMWSDYLTANTIVTAVLRKAGEEIGYTEIGIVDGDIEIVYFGLLEPFIGKGLGSASLAKVVRFAWSQPGAQRVWLHTCEHDHPNALNTYQRRGFVLYDTQE